MRRMKEFNPVRRSRVHDAFNDLTFLWRTRWADHWRLHAWVASDGLVYWDGLILDGWEPIDLT
jgi:hypothetical protein